MNIQELWSDIPGYEGFYQSSTEGRIKSLTRTVYRKSTPMTIMGELMKGVPNHKGYLLVMLGRDNIRIGRAVHKWVALTFIPNPNNLPQINHNDWDRLNNRVENLEWCTASQNMKHAYDNGLANKKGERQNRAKFTDQEARQIRGSNERVTILAKRYNVTYQLYLADKK